MANSRGNQGNRGAADEQSLTDRAWQGLEVARREATASRIAAAVAIGAAGVAYALLRNADRRESLLRGAQDLRDRVASGAEDLRGRFSGGNADGDNPA